MKFPEKFRLRKAPYGYSTKPGEPFGMFLVPAIRRNVNLLCLASAGDVTIPWDHVSVSIERNPREIPTWGEMCQIKDLFWDETEWVMQFHPAKSDYVNFHKGCLHLWRPLNPFATPPKIAVGPE